MEDVRPIVDEELCVACGTCVEACRFEVLKLRRDGPSPRGIGRCVVCGHCVAVCPEGAISHPAIPDEGLRELPEAPAVGYEQLMDLLGRRRSVRRYTDEPVSERDLRDLVDAAIVAPSGHNAQPWEFTFVTTPGRLDAIRDAVMAYYRDVLETLADDERRAAMADQIGEEGVAGMEALAPAFRLMVRAHDRGGDRLLWGAPAVGLVHASRDAPAAMPGCTYAAANMMVAAVAKGLGTCVLGFVTIPVMAGAEAVLDALELPQDHQLHVAMAIGHPALTYRRSIARREPPLRII